MLNKNNITDKNGRSFKTLRVSLTSSCNMSCVYCVNPGTIHTSSVKKQSLTTSGYLSVIRQLHQQLDLDVIRLTGGEPLLFKELPALIKGIKEIGIDTIKLTTNALTLLPVLNELHNAGLRSVNISLDSLDPVIFKKMTSVSDIRSVLDAVDACVALDMDVKINTVILKGINDHQIIPLLEYASARNVIIRFLELMKMGYLHYQQGNYFFSMDDIIDKISSVTTVARMDRAASNTATYWQTIKGAVFGIIPNETEPFCSDCNRLRLDSYGNIFGCISSNEAINVQNMSGQALTDALYQALAQKQDRFTGSELSMKYIGG